MRPARRPERPHLQLALLVTLGLWASCGGAQSPAPPAQDGGETASSLAFEDATLASGIDFQVSSGGDPPRQILEVKGGGLALLDLEGDGDQDLFVPNGATLEAPQRGPGARAWRNDGAGRFEDATQVLGLEFRRWAMGCAVGDVDGDGFDDIHVAVFGSNALFSNRAGERLVERDVVAGGSDEWSTGSAFGDLDNDGDLDLYVANYLEFDPADPPQRTTYFEADVFSGPAGLTPRADRVFENLGSGSFRDVSLEWGFEAPDAAFGLGVVILDLDQDGGQDVFVGNDSMPNFLFSKGSGESWVEQADLAGLSSNGDGQYQATMGIAVGDVNRDGRADLFTTNFERDTNTLHVSGGADRFRDRTGPMGLGAASRLSLGWATGLHDFDHDGDEDLVVFNGHVYGAEICQALSAERAQAPLLFEREGARFEARGGSQHGAWLAARHVDRSAAFGDLDSDGDVDVVVSAHDAPLRVLRNVGARGPWLQVALRQHGSANPRGLGSRVVVECGALSQTRWIHSGGSYLAASESAAHFGFPAGSPPVRVVVHWPDGTTSERTDVVLGQRLLIQRGS